MCRYRLMILFLKQTIAFYPIELISFLVIQLQNLEKADFFNFKSCPHFSLCIEKHIRFYFAILTLYPISFFPIMQFKIILKPDTRRTQNHGKLNIYSYNRRSFLGFFGNFSLRCLNFYESYSLHKILGNLLFATTQFKTGTNM